jgi:tetratricopeptide (TPR) repeat protein
MARIHKLDTDRPAKFGFKKARARSTDHADWAAQLDLFNAASAGRIVTLPSRLRPFEEALLLDERGIPSAREAYQRAIDQGDCAADAYCNLGIIRYHAGEIEYAFECFTRALSGEPRHFESHYNLANLFFDRGELEAATVQYEIAAAIDSSFPNLYFNLGLVQAILERYEPAYRSLNTFRALAPDTDGQIADELLESLRQTLAAAG